MWEGSDAYLLDGNASQHNHGHSSKHSSDDLQLALVIAATVGLAARQTHIQGLQVKALACRALILICCLSLIVAQAQKVSALVQGRRSF